MQRGQKLLDCSIFVPATWSKITEPILMRKINFQRYFKELLDKIHPRNIITLMASDIMKVPLIKSDRKLNFEETQSLLLKQLSMVYKPLPGKSLVEK